MILKYCDMFLKLKDLCDSSAFKEADINKDGTIFPKDFKDQLEKSKKYSVQEVHFLISCNQETNHEGKIDYVEFVEAYYDSAKAIGFNLAILFTNLSEHMPTDPRLARFEFYFKFHIYYLQNQINNVSIECRSIYQSVRRDLRRLRANTGDSWRHEMKMIITIPRNSHNSSKLSYADSLKRPLSQVP